MNRGMWGTRVRSERVCVPLLLRIERCGINGTTVRDSSIVFMCVNPQIYIRGGGEEEMTLNDEFLKPASRRPGVRHSTFESLRLGRSSQSIASDFLRFWDSQNFKKDREFVGITVLFLDEKVNSVIHGFTPVRRANHYKSSLKADSIVKGDRFEVVMCSNMYKITDHSFLICFISPTIIDEVITSASEINLQSRLDCSKSPSDCEHKPKTPMYIIIFHLDAYEEDEDDNQDQLVECTNLEKYNLSICILTRIITQKHNSRIPHNHPHVWKRYSCIVRHPGSSFGHNGFNIPSVGALDSFRGIVGNVAAQVSEL
ncbi:hypothetical protein YC2023_007976 [Brassica napus]